MNRGFAALPAGALTALLAAACSSSPAASPVAPSSRDSLAATVLHVVDSNGIPVEDDHIHCAPSEDGRSDTCAGLTSSEPVQRITGTFSATTSSGGSGCPGTLKVTIGPSLGYLDSSGPVKALAQTQADPCR